MVFNYSKVKASSLFMAINDSKVTHARYAREFHRDKSVVKKLYVEKYGERNVVDVTYEDIELDLDTVAGRLFLKDLIVERALLKYERNLYKHLTVAIVGMGGAGKTTYSFLSLYGAYRMLGHPPEESLYRSSLYIFFESEPFVKFVKEILNERKWVEAIIVDDIGSQISKYWIFIGEKYWAYLFSILDHLKDWSGVLIMTARHLKSIPARLRELCDIIVIAEEVSYYGLVFDLFRYYKADDITTTGIPRNKPPLYIDVMPPTVRLPMEVWDLMMDIRAEMGAKRIELVVKLFQKRREREEKMISEEEGKVKEEKSRVEGVEIEEVMGGLDEYEGKGSS